MSILNDKKENRGGKRLGAGRPHEYTVETIILRKLVPKCELEIIHKAIYEICKKHLAKK